MANRRVLASSLAMASLVFAAPPVLADTALPDWVLGSKTHTEHFVTDRCVWNFKWRAKLVVTRHSTTGYARIEEISDNNFEFCHARSGLQGITFADYPFPIRQVVYWFDDGSRHTIEIGRNSVPQVKFEDKSLVAVKAHAQFVERKWEYTWSDIPDLQEAFAKRNFKPLTLRLSKASARELHIYYESNRDRLWRKMQADFPELGPALLALNVRQDALKIQNQVTEALNALIAISKQADQTGFDVHLATLVDAISRLDRLSPENAVVQRKIAADVQLLAKHSVDVAARLRSKNTTSGRQALAAISRYAKWLDFDGTAKDLESQAADAELRFVDNASSLVDPDTTPELAATHLAFFKDMVKWQKRTLGVMTETLSHAAQQVTLGKPMDSRTLDKLLANAGKIGDGPWDRPTFRKVGRSLLPENLAAGKMLEPFFQ